MRVKLEDLHERIAFLDPAGRRKAQELKKTRANAAIVVIAADELRRIFVLDVWKGRTGAIAIANKVLELNDKWHPRLFGCEANAMQELYAEMLQQEAKHRGKTLPLIPINQPTTVDKFWRIRTRLNPVIGFGRLFYREDHYDLFHELTSFPMGQTVDIVDALASAVSLVAPRSAARRINDERDALAKYLRDQGVDPGAIERRLGEWDRQRDAHRV